MSSPRSQFIVVSDDTEILEACRAVTDQVDQLAQAQQVLEPDLLPNAMGLNDWIVLDTDYIDLKGHPWYKTLGRLPGQVIVTGSEGQRRDAQPHWANAGQYLVKNDLERGLGRLFDGVDRPKDPSQVPRPDQADTEPREHGPLDEVTLARQLGEFARRIAVLDRDRIVDTCLEQLSSRFRARLVSLYVLDDQQEHLELVGKTHPHPIDEKIRLDQNEQQPIVQAVRSRQAVLAEAWNRTAARLDRDIRGPRGEPTRSQACTIAPITAGNRVIGVVHLADPAHPSGFDARYVELIEPICDLMGAALNNARVFQEVRQQARTDGLTGLANRRTFVAQLNMEVMRARRYGTALSLAMIDMDGLKEVNDLYGHLAGDAALQEAAERIGSTLREIDVAARYGGDEFAVILPNTDLAQARRVADRLIAEMTGRPCLWQGNAFVITCSIGVCGYQDQPTGTALIETADVALYAAKSHGRSCVAAASD